MITATGLELRAGARILIESATFRIARGDRIGLVGRNGAGKTTLLRILTGQQEADSGAIQYMRGVRAGYLIARPRPPSTAIVWPVRYAACSEHR